VGTGTLAAILMSMTKLQVGVTGAMLAAGAASLVVQAGDNSDLRREVAALEAQNQMVAQLKADNQRLARQATEVAELRRDDAEFARLRDEAMALQVKLKAEAAARAARAALPLTGEIFDIAQVDQTPRPKFQARPEYPAELRKAGMGGEAVVAFAVDAEGFVRNAKAVRSKLEPAKAAGQGGDFTVQGTGRAGGEGVVPNGASLLEAAALEAVKKWQFAPGEKGGRKVNTRMQVPIVFTLAESGSVPAPTLWF
jgi:TonB family protein